jgi:hypothetical protein
MRVEKQARRPRPGVDAVILQWILRDDFGNFPHAFLDQTFLDQTCYFSRSSSAAMSYMCLCEL